MGTMMRRVGNGLGSLVTEDGKMHNFSFSISNVIDRYSGLRDPLSMDLYDWNNRLKEAKDPSEIDSLITELKEEVFVDCMGQPLTVPVISERLLLKKDRKDLSGEEVSFSLVWNTRELVRFERLSNQPIERRVHELACSILQLPEFVEEMNGEYEMAIEDFTSELEKDILRNKKELISTNKLIKQAIDTQQQKAETTQFNQECLEEDQNREIRALEEEKKLTETKAFHEAKTEEIKGRFSSVSSNFSTSAEECDKALTQGRAVTQEARNGLHEAWSANYKVSFDIGNKEKRLSGLQTEISNLQQQINNLL